MRSRNVKNGASCKMILKAIPQISMEQQHSEQHMFDSSSACGSFVPPPRDFLALVAVKTIVNCIKLQDQMLNVKNTKIGSLAILLSLKESKNSIISAAVPVRIYFVNLHYSQNTHGLSYQYKQVTVGSIDLL